MKNDLPINLAIDLDPVADWDVFVCSIALMIAFGLCMAVIGPDLVRRFSPVERLVRGRWFGV